jgi:predicted KAP-like P-loop ATPase
MSARPVEREDEEQESAEAEMPVPRAEAEMPAQRAQSAMPEQRAQSAMPEQRAQTASPPREPDAPTPGPATGWPRTLLAVRGSTRFYAAIDHEPWQRPIDLLVVPADQRPFDVRGELAEALDALSPALAKERHATIEQALATREKPIIEPRTPLLFPFPANFELPPWGALATAIEQGAAPENAAIAAKYVLSTAASEGLPRVAIPMIGAGRGGLDASEVMLAMLRTLLAGAGFPGVAEVTLVTVDEAALEAAQTLLAGQVQSFANDMVDGTDLLDVDAEVSALAEALLLRDVEPPLVAGIFGGWGSGKSFAMHLMQRRMGQIRALPVAKADAWPKDRDGAFPWVGHVYVVRFDAWTFAKSNLWASLMQTIFRDLNHQLTLEAELSGRDAELALKGGEAYGALLLESASDRASGSAKNNGRDPLWEELQRQKKIERDRLVELEKALAARREELADARRRLTWRVEQEIEQRSREVAWEALERALAGEGKKVLEALRAGLDMKTTDNRAHEAVLAVRRALQLDAREAISVVLLMLGGILVTSAAAFVTGHMEKTGALIGTSTVGGVLGLITGVWRAAAQWREKLAGARAAFDRHVAEERERRRAAKESHLEMLLEGQRKAATESSEPVAGNVPSLEREVDQLSSQVERQRARIGVTASFVSLSQFVSTRLEQQVYEKELGLIHQVQQDLSDLTEGLAVHRRDSAEALAAKHELFPRGPARVVLFIDDLDRCPPNKVVEVLEAAQLLVKTRLFVVVLAMDERFITRALEKVYAGVLYRHGDPSGLDYIEKIVQIPYRVRSIHGHAVNRYLAAQMRVSAKAPQTTGRPRVGAGKALTPETPSPAKGAEPTAGAAGAARAKEPSLGVLPSRVVEFSPEELEDLADACNAVGLTPRAIKRLVNVYKLLKIIWYRPNGYPTPSREERRVIVTLLSLTARLPVTMRRMLESLAAQIGESHENLAKTMAERAKALGAEIPARDIEMIEQATQVMTARGALSPSSMTRANYQLLRSFCFIGDIGRESRGAEGAAETPAA